MTGSRNSRPSQRAGATFTAAGTSASGKSVKVLLVWKLTCSLTKGNF